MMKTFIESKRLYEVTTTVNGINEQFEASFCYLIEHRENESETLYAIQEQIDIVMDLKPKESMYFQPNRDDKDSKGIITRKW